MAKVDKYYEGYMTGKCSALDLVKEHGIEALEADIRMRKAYPVPCDMTQSEWDKVISTIGHGCKNTIFAMIYIILHEDFGFGKDRLNKFYDGFEKRFNAILELSPLGNRYVSLVDYAVVMKEKYPDLRIDIDRIAVEEDGYLDKAEIRTTEADGIIAMLRANGYSDAAEYLESRKYNKE